MYLVGLHICYKMIQGPYSIKPFMDLVDLSICLWASQVLLFPHSSVSTKICFINFVTPLSPHLRKYFISAHVFCISMTTFEFFASEV